MHSFPSLSTQIAKLLFNFLITRKDDHSKRKTLQGIALPTDGIISNASKSYNLITINSVTKMPSAVYLCFAQALGAFFEQSAKGGNGRRHGSILYFGSAYRKI